MFNKNETVCFLGDSITTHGHFVKEVFQFLVDNHKEDRVKIYNCGVPGDAACRTIDRLYEDCLILNPTTVVLMLGANDIERALYMPNKEIENVEEKLKLDISEACKELAIYKRISGVEIRNFVHTESLLCFSILYSLTLKMQGSRKALNLPV